jgi:hypothetical protein
MGWTGPTCIALVNDGKADSRLSFLSFQEASRYSREGTFEKLLKEVVQKVIF